MKPAEIFMDDFERTEWADSHYAIIGRALVFASRFESGGKRLSALIGLRKHRSILDSEKDIDSFMEELRKRSLATHFAQLGLNQGEADDILKEARLARNEVAHEIALGMDLCLDLLPKNAMPDLVERVRVLSIRMAKGDFVISVFASVLTKEPVPGNTFLGYYVDRVTNWICES